MIDHFRLNKKFMMNFFPIHELSGLARNLVSNKQWRRLTEAELSRLVVASKKLTGVNELFESPGGKFDQEHFLMYTT